MTTGLDIQPRTTPSEARPSAVAVFGLGTFDVVVDGLPVQRWRAGKARNLLQYMLLRSGCTVSREALYDALWPNASTSGSSSLKVAVHMLRNVLPAAPPSAGARRAPLSLLTCDAGYLLEVGDVWVDFQEFDRLVDRAHVTEVRGDPAAAAALYRRAMELYRGDFLPAVSMDWAEVHREWLRSRALYALDRLRAADFAAGDRLAVTVWCRRMVEMEPLREDAFRTLIVLHGCAGELEQARRWFDLCRARTREGLGLDPDPATARLAAQALRGELLGMDPAELAWAVDGRTPAGVQGSFASR